MMKPNTDYNDMFNSGVISFDAPEVSLYIEHVDPISALEQERDTLLNKLGDDKDVFINWLTTVNIKHISTLKMQTLDLLINCWLTSKTYHSINRMTAELDIGIPCLHEFK